MNEVGLCSECVHSRVITARRSRFYFCERSLTDPAFPRYPRLPVVVCSGFEPRRDTESNNTEGRGEGLR